MHATVMIVGPKSGNDEQQSFGGIFAMALLKQGSAERTLILVTAAHA